MSDRDRICLAGYPNGSGLQCRFGNTLKILNCKDLEGVAVIDTHLPPASVAKVILCETLDYFYINGTVAVIMTTLGAEEVMEINDPFYFGEGSSQKITLTGRDGKGKGCWVTLITGRNDALGFCETTVRFVALLRHCGFVFYEYPDRIAIRCDRKALETPLRKLKLYAHGYALHKYDSDTRAVAKYNVVHYLNATFQYDVRSTVIFQSLTSLIFPILFFFKKSEFLTPKKS